MAFWTQIQAKKSTRVPSPVCLTHGIKVSSLALFAFITLVAPPAADRSSLI
jgi:hypothetical protein